MKGGWVSIKASVSMASEAASGPSAASTTGTIFSRQVHLRRALRRDEHPCAEHFDAAASVRLGPLTPAQVLVRVIYTSVDPYLFQYALLQPSNVGLVQSRAVGIVEASCEAPDFPAGCFVYGSFGWASHAVATASGTVTVTMADGTKRAVSGSDALRRIELPARPYTRSPLPRFLGVLGMPGLAAYAGVVRILRPSAGKTIFVSSAAGAVGLVAGQVARVLGARVVGSTSSAAKCSFLLDHGFDAAFDYTAVQPEGYTAALAPIFPDGVDGYFDCVGGSMLDAVLGLANDHAAVAVCGLMSTLPQPDAPDARSVGTPPARGAPHNWELPNFSRVLTKQIRIEGFQAREHFDLFGEYCDRMASWLESGDVKYAETISDGLESCPQALSTMLEGKNLGKMLVQVSPDPLTPPGKAAAMLEAVKFEEMAMG